VTEFAYNRLIVYDEMFLGGTRSHRLDVVASAPSAEVWRARVDAELHSLYRGHVGGAILRAIHDRTTIYYERGSITYPEPVPEPAHGPRPPPSSRAIVIVDVFAEHSMRGSLPTALHVTFAHELTHAMFITNHLYRGGLAPDPEPQRIHAPSWDEAEAVVIENMQRSEARMPLRSSYDDSAPIRGELTAENTHIPIREIEERTVWRCRTFIPWFARELERIPEAVCRYNPFRARPVPDRTRLPAAGQLAPPP
jgi:hypothetical protein